MSSPDSKQSREASIELRNRVLQPGEERDRLFLEHPFCTDRTYLATPPVQAAYDEIATCIIQRDSARLFVGEPRTGKTYSIEVLQGAVAEVFKNVVILSINAKQHDAKTEKACFGDLLEDLGLAFEDRTTAAARRLRFKQHIKAKCAQLDSSIVVIFVDESQNWKDEEFTFIRDVANDLGKFDSINLMVIHFAQPQILTLCENLRAKQRNDLVGRYMRDPIELSGIGKLSDLTGILQQCDDPQAHEYPRYSGIALTEFCLPVAYSSGWRLANEAALLWEFLLKEVGAKNSKDVSFGMAWIMSSVRDFMFQAMEVESKNFTGTPLMWESAVKCGRYSSLWR